MTELRTRMDNDLLVRGRAERTRESYLGTTMRYVHLARRTVLATASPLEWLDLATPAPPSA